MRSTIAYVNLVVSDLAGVLFFKDGILSALIRLLLPVYQSQACQKKDWSEHKKHCTKTQKKDETTSNTDSDTPPNTIKAVLSLGGQNNPFNVEPTTIPLDHPLFTPGPRQQLSYVSCLIDVPIIIWRHRTDDPMDHLTSDIRPSLDNSSITFLMIDPWSGWAPAEWQQGIGPVSLYCLPSPVSTQNLSRCITV